MEEVLIQVKNEILRLLKGLDPDVDVFFEEIKATDEEHGIKTPKTYYFVDIIPDSSTEDRFLAEIGVLVDVAYHEERESNTAYLIKAGELAGLFRPVFSFGDRHITVPAVRHKVTDHVLHTSFSLSFLHQLAGQAGHEVMGELDVAVKKERK